MTLEEIYRSDIFKVIEYNYRFMEETNKEESNKKKGIVGEISSDEAFDML